MTESTYSRSQSQPGPSFEPKDGIAGRADRSELKSSVLVVNCQFPGNGGTRIDKYVKFFPEYGVEPVILSARELTPSDMQDDISSRLPEWLDVNQARSIGWTYFAPNFLSRGPTSKHYRLLKFLSLPERFVLVPDHMVRWIPDGRRLARKIFKERKIDAVFTSSPYESTHLIGLDLKRRFGVRWVADFRDLWTGKKLAYRPASRLHDRWIQRLEKKILSEADHVIANTLENKEHYVSRFGLDRDRISVIPNGFDPDDLDPTVDYSPADNVFRIGHMGHMSKTSYPWKILLHAVNRLANSVGRTRVCLVHCGYYTREIKAFVEKHNMGDIIEATGMLPHSKAMPVVAGTDVQVVLLYDTPDSKTLAPMKLYNYLIMPGKILGIAPEDGAVARVINETGTGEVISPTRGQDDVYRCLRNFYSNWEQDNAQAIPDESRLRPYNRRYHVGRVVELLNLNNGGQDKRDEN